MLVQKPLVWQVHVPEGAMIATRLDLKLCHHQNQLSGTLRDAPHSEVFLSLHRAAITRGGHIAAAVALWSECPVGSRHSSGSLHEVVEVEEGGNDAAAHLGPRQLHQADLALQDVGWVHAECSLHDRCRGPGPAEG